MPVCQKCAVEYAEGAATSATHNHLNLTPSQSQKERELFLDNAFSSAVVGGTAQFVSFLLVFTTQATVSVVENLLLTSFIGLCAGLIAYALLTGYDQLSPRQRESSSKNNYRAMPDEWA